MTSLQDGGRVGAARHGLSRSGAMDRLALAEANALVGNPAADGAIELTLLGATLTVEDGPVRLALRGAAMAVRLNGEPVPPGSSFTAAPGDTVAIGAATTGIFAYLAAGGGYAVPPSLGSVSLQPRAGIGGLDGRAFRDGDRVPLRTESVPTGPELSLPWTPADPDAPVRVVLGPQDDYFDPDAVATFLSTAYTISDEADRMGYRLAGPAIPHARGFNIVSDGIVAGSIQVPGSGVPMVMMADHQTTGGYPKIATVASADLRVLAQRRRGDTVRFEAVDVGTAQALARERAALVASLPGRVRAGRGGVPDVAELLALNLAGAAVDALAADAP